MNTEKIKLELLSILHTFLSVFVPILLINLNNFDFTTLSKESLIALVVAVLRSSIKATWNKVANSYFPTLSSSPK